MYLVYRIDGDAEQLIGYADDQVEAAQIIETDRDGHPDADYRFEEERHGRSAEGQG